MGASIFLYSFFTSKKEIQYNNIKQWFWLELLIACFQRNKDFFASWPTRDEGRVVGAWSVVCYWQRKTGFIKEEVCHEGDNNTRFKFSPNNRNLCKYIFMNKKIEQRRYLVKTGFTVYTINWHSTPKSTNIY